MQRLEEATRVILTLWSQSPASFDGEFYSLDGVHDLPLPIQQHHHS